MNNNLPSSHLRFARQRAASLAVSTDNARSNFSATTMRDRRGGDSQSSESVGEIPHTPGADICFCAVCHLRPTRFPRRQDGRIMLPDPMAVSAAGAASRFGGQEGTPRARTRRMTEAVQDIDTRSELGFGIGTGNGTLGGGGGGGSSTSSLRSSRRARTRSNAYGDLERVREDRGEGPSTSTHVKSRSGMRSGTSDSHSLYSAGLDDSEVSHVGESPMHSSLRGPSRGRHSSMTDRVRPHRTSKPYEPKSSRPDPWPRILTGNQRETTPNLPGHLPTAYSDPHHSTTTTSLAGRERREPSPNPYEALGSARNSQVADSSTSLDTREANIANSSTLPHTHTQTQILTHNRRGSESYTTTTNTTTANASNSSYYRHTSSIPFNQEQTTTTTNHYLSISAREAISPPQVIRFKSRAQNPQPQPWSVWTPNSPPGGGQPYMRPPDTGRSDENILSRTTGLTGSHARDPSTSMESVVDDIHQPHSGSNSSFQNQPPPSSQIRRGTPPHSFASSTSSTTLHHQEFLPADTGTSSSIRFENPVTPQLHVELNSSRPPRQASGTPNSQAQTPQMQTQSQTQVPVKWDSERKRRQGYFAANDDGEEKSSFRYYNFRHYNETALQKTYLE